MDRKYLYDREGNWCIVPLRNTNGYGFEPRELEIADELIESKSDYRNGSYEEVSFTFRVKDLVDNDAQELSEKQIFKSKEDALKYIKYIITRISRGDSNIKENIVFPKYINDF